VLSVAHSGNKNPSSPFYRRIYQTVSGMCSTKPRCSVLADLVAFFWAIWLRREIENEWLMALSDVLSVLFGVIPAVLPGGWYGLLASTS
jgi:hypothetical protein